MGNSPPYTFIIRKSALEYVAVCIELNVSARGADLPEVQRNLMNAIRDYLECAHEESIVVEHIPLDELVEFLRDTSPWKPESLKDFQALELNEVPVYALTDSFDVQQKAGEIAQEGECLFSQTGQDRSCHIWEGC